jgi:hypothetical protein
MAHPSSELHVALCQLLSKHRIFFDKLPQSLYRRLGCGFAIPWYGESYTTANCQTEEAKAQGDTRMGNDAAISGTVLHMRCSCVVQADLLLHACVSVVAYDAHTNAGADVLFLAAKAEGAFVLVCKPEKASSLLECLRSSSPAWQYTTREQRGAVIHGQQVPVVSAAGKELVPWWSALRIAFSALWEDYEATFQTAVRVAFCASGYEPTAVNTVMHRNTLMSSPILLCNATTVFGALSGALAILCKGEPVSNTKHAEILLPQHAGAVNASKLGATRSGSPDLSSKTRNTTTKTKK